MQTTELCLNDKCTGLAVATQCQNKPFSQLAIPVVPSNPNATTLSQALTRYFNSPDGGKNCGSTAHLRSTSKIAWFPRFLLMPPNRMDLTQVVLPADMTIDLGGYSCKAGSPPMKYAIIAIIEARPDDRVVCCVYREKQWQSFERGNARANIVNHFVSFCSLRHCS